MSHLTFYCYYFFVELREEIEALQEIVRRQSSAGGEGVTVLNANESQEQVKELQKRLKEYEKLMKEQTRSWEERLRTTQERKVEEAEQLKVLKTCCS